MSKYYYVYLLTDVSTGTHHYTGFTEDLTDRLARHNRGQVSHIAPFSPWRIETSITFTSEEKARVFESYLKSGSGRAFATKHF